MDLISSAKGVNVVVLSKDEDGPVFAGDGFDWAALERRRAVSEASCSLGLVGQRLVAAAATADAEQAVRQLILPGHML